jgi:hypothetical protein
MSFRVLRPDGADRALWHEALQRFPAAVRDLHYLPEYGLIYRDSFGHEPALAVYERNGSMIVHAFLVRSLTQLPFLGGVSERFVDIATPYGFGGPLLSDPTRADAADSLRAFDAAFRDWCLNERIASEFVVLHPVLGNHAPIAASAIADPVQTKHVVIVDLQLPDEELWARVSRGTRSSINRARREGVVVEQVVADAAALETFRRLYLATMRRRNAAERWFVPERYFTDCVQRLGTDASALFFARCEREVAAAYLLLSDANSAYYHFGASDEAWLERRPNNLLMYETLLWAKRRGLRAYHLGGGVTAAEEDSLLRFKSSYGGRKSMLYTYGRILDQDVYRHLCALKLRHEQETSQSIGRPDYFPLYRR